MSYIRTQRVIRNEKGVITAGNASIEKTVYVKDKSKGYHSKHVSEESLGKIVWLSPDKQSGIFLSRTRGLVEYDSATGEFKEVDREDPRLPEGELFPDPPVHTIFGDAYMLMRFLHDCGMSRVLAEAFPEMQRRERLLAHILHGILKDGGRISCGDFIGKSVASNVLSGVPVKSLASDTAFFMMMGEDKARIEFFRAFVREMRRRDPSFGHCCFVDTTPLPNDIAGIPTNALCSHGLESTSVQTRLTIVLDKATGLPVWFAFIPGNVLDFNTLRKLLEDVEESLDITIEDLTLDAGYVTFDLLRAREEGVFDSLIARMPAKNGFPFHELYKACKRKFHSGRYEFSRNMHTYFGEKKATKIDGMDIFAYVYVDWINAYQGRSKWEENNPGAYEAMTGPQKDWRSVQDGFFVLISDKDKQPSDILDDYFGRMDMEPFNETSKECFDLLPPSSWSVQTVWGKVLYDIMNTIVLLLLRKDISARKDKKYARSTSYIIGKCQSLMCLSKKNGTISVETPNKQAKEAFRLVGISIPSNVGTMELRNMVLCLGDYAPEDARQDGSEGMGGDSQDGKSVAGGSMQVSDKAGQRKGAGNTKKRGRPKGSKDKNPRKKKGPASDKASKAGDADTSV